MNIKNPMDSNLGMYWAIEQLHNHPFIVHQNDLNDLKIQNSCVHYVVWRRPDETRLYSTLLMVSHPESCLFRLIINNMIICLIEAVINKKGTH
jgi:hypothetical protein